QVNFSEAMENAAINLPRAIGIGVGDWAKGYVTSKEKGKKLTGFLIYMPLVMKGPGGGVAITTPAKVRFGQEKVPIKIVFGGPAGAAGQLTGIGMEMGSLRQLVRMDYHSWAPGHGGISGLQGGEMVNWVDGSFHYHVRFWNQ
ncbi:hypothetical protein, partial [Andreprevotia sp. IGB-42]|uniref:hypothetical protein n=1 Tax=Andreprevotia sp. IGB-42 TaxID=2497473 RepID=UPI00135BE343